MDSLEILLSENQKVFFASDFHLGAPDPESSIAELVDGTFLVAQAITIKDQLATMKLRAGVKRPC